MLIVGLTGGISTGKSTVSRHLKEKHNAAIVDADVIAREVVEPGKPAYNAIIDHFGGITPHLVSADGSKQLNRAALGRTVFGSEEHRKALNAIVHPAVRKAIALEVFAHYIRGRALVFLDVPLLFESKLDQFCGLSVAVLCSAEAQFERLRARDPQLTPADARERIAAQMPLSAKRARADIVVENDGALSDLHAQIDDLLAHPPLARPFWLTALQWIIPIGLVWGMLVYYQRRRALAKL